mgnify:CR=1 FL=1
MTSNRNSHRTSGGIYGLSETPQQFFARIAEINRLEIMLKMQTLSPEETDGIELKLGNFGPDYPAGLFVAQDGMNEPAAQNFKLVSWAEVLAKMGQ